MPGAQSRGLVISAKMKGWNPTRIADTQGGDFGPDLSKIDVDPAMNNFDYLGRMADAPEGMPSGGNPVLQDQPAFYRPDAARENADRRTTDANPYPGGGFVGTPPPAGGTAAVRKRGMEAMDTSVGAGDAPGLNAADPSGQTP